MDFFGLAVQCAPEVEPSTLAAIVRTESAFNPYAIGVNGGKRLSRAPSSKEEAILNAKFLIERGYNIDLGLGQINMKNLSKLGFSVEDAFEPCMNLSGSARLLQQKYTHATTIGYEAGQPALKAAISTYNTGSTKRGFENGYVRKVLLNAKANDKPFVKFPNSIEQYEIIPLVTVNTRQVSNHPPRSKQENVPQNNSIFQSNRSEKSVFNRQSQSIFR
jgi:type IV secretion system protein VirB1